MSGCSLISEPPSSTNSADKTISASGSSDKQQHGRARHATIAGAASLSDTHLQNSGGAGGGGDAARLSLNENELARNKSRRLEAAAAPVGSADKTISAADGGGNDDTVRKNGFRRENQPFSYKNDQFAKTGSGQT
eukprot:COSAG06_NODE_253_length_19061_cov_33.083114_1_plen_135_part_00